MRALGTGAPEPLGLTLVDGGANVAVFSAHASAIELCLFDADGETECDRIVLPERTGDVFHAFVPDIAAGARYGLRAHGPYDPRHGHRFNAAKLLVDPYATALDRRFVLHAASFGELPDGKRNDADSAPFVPKAIAVAPSRIEERHVHVSWRDTILYELHVRGFTKLLGAVPEPLRGTCAGLAHPAAIEHLARLGVTSVELMPVAAAIDEPHLAAHGLANYWRYNPVAFLAADPWLAPGGCAELAATIAALHAAGIEVLIDVVLNHSGEGNALGPTLSLRGLDNATYYRTLPGDGAQYVNDTGCGNTLALDRPPVLRLAMDALRHYAALGADGFRFDLATVLGRRDDGFDPAAPLLQAIAQDPALRALKLCAEPWDLGPGGYQLGAFPDDWGEWNDAYRDIVRLYWRGDRGMVGPLATRVAGSADIFAPRKRPLSRSINFVTAHDGFTLADLVSYEAKHNTANGEENRDGTDANYSWNYGVEGPSADPTVVAARAGDVRALLVSLLFSRGTPMLAMGDEMGRSQQGNNNGYAQDSPLTWIDWDHADGGLVAFTTRLIALRKAHPALHGDRPLTGRPLDATGIPDVDWLRPDGTSMTAADWSAANAQLLIAALYTPAHDGAPADRVAIAFNTGREPVAVQWPEPRPEHGWQVAIDTSRTGENGMLDDDRCLLAARSVQAVIEVAAATPVRRSRAVAPEALARLADALGVAPEWTDIAGRRHVVGRDTVQALLAAMGMETRTTFDAHAHLAAIADLRERRRLPPVCVARAAPPIELAIAVDDGTRSRRRMLRLTDEQGAVSTLAFDADDCPVSGIVAVDGREVTQRRFRLPALAEGYHTLAFEDEPERPCRVIVAPARCHLPPELARGERRFGLAAHLYALRRAGDQGIGDFTTLAHIGAATAKAGGAIVGLNPLHALFGEQRERASPYHPSDRRFLDPIYIDVESVPDFRDSPDARALANANAGVLRELAARASIDYAGVWAQKRALLAACFATFAGRTDGDPLVAEFERFVAGRGEALTHFARFEAIAAAHPRAPWFAWPAALAHPSAEGIAAFAAQNDTQVRFALYLQWLAERQLAAAARVARAAGLTLGFYRDLAIGSAPDGAEAWANTGGMLARGVSIGAPPDPLAERGQNWNLPPPIPHALVASAYAGYRELVNTNMRHAGALRIDHVMGVTRMFWIPDGATPLEGAYVRYPQEDLLAILALESERARCLVVGEDLGTVPEALRARLDAAAILSYRVLWFERDGKKFRRPNAYTPKATACVSTHDLPTIAGWWSGVDVDEKETLGLLDPAVAQAARHERVADKKALATALADAAIASVDPAAPHTPQVTAAVHRYIGATSSALTLLQADDLAGETVALNVPGTDRERPNWRRKISVDVEELWSTPAGVAATADLSARKA